MESTQQKSKAYLIIIAVFIIVFIIYTAGFIWRVYNKTPRYMLIINPAHGGKKALSSELDGDRFNPLQNVYTKNYDEGLIVKNKSEYKILLELSKKIRNKLEYAKGYLGWGKFRKILQKYGQSKDYKPVIFDVRLTKENDYHYYLRKGKKDINKYFRLFDFPSKGLNKKEGKGILSLINKHNPDIVLNFDFNYQGKMDKELFSINVPDFEFFNYIKKKLLSKKMNFNKHNDIISCWYGMSKGEKKKNLIKDTWIYFTGIMPDETLFNPSKKFFGHGYNLLHWKYCDKDYLNKYKNKEENSEYNNHLSDFRPLRKFWKREKFDVEKYRRVCGDYDCGDNMYVSEEIIKYIIAVLTLNKDENVKKLVKKPPVYSYNEGSLYVNSIVININLGSLFDEYTRTVFSEKLDQVADAVCIGLYSICRGYDLKEFKNLSIKPEGKPIDFMKYYKHKYFGGYRKSYK